MARQIECGRCGGIETGNIRPPWEVAIKCSKCVQGEVEYINNRPDEFPEAHLTMKEINAKLARKRTQMRLERLKSNS